MKIQSPGDDFVKKLTEIPFKKKLAKTGHPSTYADDLKLLYELQVQQLEMEMQNEELRANKLSLEELNRKHFELFEFAPNGYFTLTHEGTIKDVNLTGSNLLGIKKSKLLCQLFKDYIFHEDKDIFQVCWFNLVETNGYQVFKVRLSRPDGQLLFVRIGLSIVESNNNFQVLLAMTDVTMVKQIEDAQTFLMGCSWAQSGKDFFHALAEYLGKSLGMDCICIDKLMAGCMEAQSMAVYCDGQSKENRRYKINETALGNRFEQKSFCIPNDVCKLFPNDSHLQQIKAESCTGVTLWGSGGKPIGFIWVVGRKPLVDSRLTEMVLKQVSIRAASELEHRQLEEEIIQSCDVLEVLVRERTEELEKSNEQLRNEISHRKKAESILLDSQKYLRQLTQRIDAVAEEERIRIAREIHDELGHLLTALKYDMDVLINQSTIDMESVKSELGTMIGMIDSLIDSVRKIATELRPGILDHLGLFPVLEWQIRQFRMRTKICCTFSMSEMDATFDKNQTTIIYRIFQEILTNITRHSKAKHVQVLITKQENDFVLKVIDNGVGFEPIGCNNANYLGLMGMQERAMSIGGELHIESMQGIGTTITFSLPKVKFIHPIDEIYA